MDETLSPGADGASLATREALGVLRMCGFGLWKVEIRLMNKGIGGTVVLTSSSGGGGGSEGRVGVDWDMKAFGHYLA